MPLLDKKKPTPPPSNTPASPAKRGRGAPRGNSNAQKHGFFSRSIRGIHAPRIQSPLRGGLQSEIDLLRVMFHRLARDILGSSWKDRPLDEHLFALHTLSISISRLHSMLQTQRAIFPASEDKVLQWTREHGIDLDELSRELDEDDPESPSAGPALPLSVGRFGNKNALKHGFYADLFTPEEIQRLETNQGMTIQDQVLLLRDLIKRTVHSFKLKEFAQATLAEKSRALRVVSFASATLERLERTAGMAASPSALLDKAVTQVLREINPPPEES